MKKKKLTKVSRYATVPPSLSLLEDPINKLIKSLSLSLSQKWMQWFVNIEGKKDVAAGAHKSMQIHRHVAPATHTWKDGTI